MNHQIISNKMRITVDGPDFVTPPILEYGMNNAKDIAIPIGISDIKSNIALLCKYILLTLL